MSTNNFVYSRKDLMVAGVAAAIVVVMLGLGFGLSADGASLPSSGTTRNVVFDHEAAVFS